MAATPAIAASARLSVTSWRMRRPRLAPSDRRKAISGLRAAPRASRRLARFAHAISRSTPTAASSAVSDWENSIARRRRSCAPGLNSKTLIQKLAPPFPRRGGAVERLQAGLKDGVGLRLGLSRRHARLQSSEHVEPHHFVGRRIVQPIAAGQHAGLHAQREPEVRLLPAGFADEARRRDADDGQRRLRSVKVLPSTSGRPPKRRCQ